MIYIVPTKQQQNIVPVKSRKGHSLSVNDNNNNNNTLILYTHYFEFRIYHSLTRIKPKFSIPPYLSRCTQGSFAAMILHAIL